MTTVPAVTHAGATLTPRSPRALIVLPETGMTATSTATGSSLHRSLEWMGRVWGGAHMSVVPIVDGAIPEVFNKLAAAYDPDLLLQWGVTVTELAARDVRAAVDLVAGSRGSARDGGGVCDPELTSDRNSDLAPDPSLLLTDHSLTGPAPSDTNAFLRLQERLPLFSATSDGIAPMSFAHHLQTNLPIPLTDLRRVASVGQVALSRWSSQGAQISLAQPPSSMDIDLAGCGHWLATLLKMRLGIVGRGGRPEVADRPEGGEPYISYTFDPSDDETRMKAIGIGLVGATVMPRTERDTWCSSAALNSAPLNQTKRGLDEFTYTLNAPRPLLIVVGDTVADACLYHLWTRVYGESAALWISTAVMQSIIANDSEVVAEHIKEFVYSVPAQRRASITITSFTEQPTDLGVTLDAVVATGFYDHHTLEALRQGVVSSPDDLDVPTPPSLLVAAPEAFETFAPLVLRDGASQVPVRSPIPDVLKAQVGISPPVVNWVCDAIIEDTLWPPRPQCAGSAESAPPSDASPLADKGWLRCSKGGTSWVGRSQANVPAGLNVEHATNVAWLRTVDVRRVLDALIEPGWRWTLSSNGNFYQGLNELAGGLTETLRLLRDPVARPILQGLVAGGLGYKLTNRTFITAVDAQNFLSAATTSEAEPPEVVRGEELDADPGVQRRDDEGHLAPQAVSDDVVATLDWLTARGILLRGLKLQCQRCRHTGFYRIGQVADHFMCNRCSDQQPLGVDTWRDATKDSDPAWFYGLDELVYQALDQDIEGPAFTLQALGAPASGHRYVWAVELYGPKGERLEVDFVHIHDGRLTVGEAKTSDHLGKGSKPTGSSVRRELAKTEKAARLLRADLVVFATTQPAWNSITAAELAGCQPRAWES